MSDSGEPSAVERLLRRERTVTAAGLAVLCALAWIYLSLGAGMAPLAPAPSPAAPMADMPGMAGMDMGGMDMGGAASAPAAWDARLWALTVAMWASMMVAMMTPSAAPAVLLYARVHRHAAARDRDQGLAPSGVFAAGYLLVWTAFSIAAAGAQWGLDRGGLVSSALMSSESRWLTAGLLVGAGLYQLSPLQSVCLSHCRSPAQFFSRHWRPGALGALRLGVLHGAYCVGCCWALMALLFVGGVMNLAWIAGLTLVVLAQKLLPGGVWIGRACGVALVAWGLATLVA